MTIQNLSDRIVNNGGGGGDGAVTSVNNKTGDVVLNTSDIGEAGDNLYLTSAERSKIAEVDGKEDDLGNPLVDGYILASTTTGNRSWIPQPSGGGGGDVSSVNGQTGAVLITPDTLDDTDTAHKFATEAQLNQISNNETSIIFNTSQIANNATDITTKEDSLGTPAEDGFVLTSDTNGNRSWISVTSEGGDSGVISVNGKQGIVTINPDDLDDSASDHKFVTAEDLSNISLIPSLDEAVDDIEDDIIIVNQALLSKEDSLGNPSTNGDVLSSDTSGNRTWVSLPEIPDAPVDSVFGRTGEVIAQFGDYDADEIDDSTTVHKFVNQAQIAQISTNASDIAGKEDAISAGTTAQYYRGDKTFQNLNKGAVGLSNVDNTSDVNKPISNATQLELDNKIESSEKGAANGVATLDDQGKVNTSQLPSYVSAVQEYPTLGDFPVSGEGDIIYIAIDTGYVYRWTGSTYVQLSDQTAVWGEISGNIGNQTDLQTALSGKIPTTSLGTAGGVATLDGSGTVPLSQIPEGIGGGLTPELVSLASGFKVLEDGKAYLVKPDESVLGNNQLILPTGQTGFRVFISDINYKFGSYNVILQAQTGQTIDGFENLILDVDHCWLDLFFIDGEWKTVDPYSGG